MVFRVTDPRRLGQVLAEIRSMLGISRWECAQQIAEATGRAARSVSTQLWSWDTGASKPESWSLGPYLDVIDFDLALTPRPDPEAPPSRIPTLLASIDNALRNGSYMTGANLALDMLCDELKVNRTELPPFDPRWAVGVPDRE